MTRPPTLMDVALVAGVSKSLVSLAVRGKPGVRDATRERILEAAERLGYRTNSWARSLVSGSSGVIGIIVADMRSGYHTDVARGIEDALTPHGLTSVIGDGRYNADRLRAQVERMLTLGVDGLVVVAGLAEPAVVAPAVGVCPVVVVGRPRALPHSAGQVRNDDEVGAQLAVHHLMGLGHRRIAHLAGSTRAASMARRAAYCETMTRVGLDAQVFDAVPAAVVAAAAPDGPTAVFCSNDQLAAQLIGVAADAGVSVPGRLSVMGYDNIDLAAIVRPGLSTVDQPRRRMGELAAAQMVELLGGAIARGQVVSPELVLRDSTAEVR